MKLSYLSGIFPSTLVVTVRKVAPPARHWYSLLINVISLYCNIQVCNCAICV